MVLHLGQVPWGPALCLTHTDWTTAKMARGILDGEESDVKKNLSLLMQSGHSAQPGVEPGAPFRY